MKNKKIVIILVVILIAAVICNFIVISYKALTNLYDEKIFSSMSDFEFLESYEINEESLHDEYLEDLNPTESYVSSVEYDGEIYHIYAYIFNNPDDAYEYFIRTSGQRDKSQFGCDLYAFSRYYWGSRFWAYNENCAYRVEGGAYVPFAQFMTWLTKDFPYDLRELIAEDAIKKYEESTTQSEQATETPQLDEDTLSRWEEEVFNRFYNTDNTQADQLFEQIIETLENSDASSLKEMFSPDATISAQNIDEKIKALLDFYDGEMTEYQRYGPASYASKNGSAIVKEITVSYDVTTTIGVYRIAFKFCTHDSLTPDNIGLCSIYIIKAEDSDMSFAYWGGDKWDPGITIESD